MDIGEPGENDTRERLKVRRRVQEAITLYESAGKKVALERIADPEGPFVEGKHYVFALDLEGHILAHPFLRQVSGADLTGLKDSEGRSFIRKILSRATIRGYGFVEYRWPVPNSKEERHKTVFFEQVDGIILCSGFYTAGPGFLESMHLPLGT